MSAIRVALAGAAGKMGSVIGPGLERTEGISLVARIEVGDDLVAACRAARAAVVVDFTSPDAAAPNARKIVEAGAHGVIGTTGFRPADLDDLDRRARGAGVGLLVAANFALGAVLAQRFAAEAARHFSRAEIVEMHHDQKKDAPSGTALRTAEAIAAAGGGVVPPIHSVRLPGLLAHQETLFGGLGEVLTIRHDAMSRECYLAGVVLAIRAMAKGDRVGVVRGLEAVLVP